MTSNRIARATPSIVQPTLLSRMNEQTILRVIQDVGPLSRIDLARRTGMTAPTASKAVDSLLRNGWLEEDDSTIEPTRGRPARKVRLPRESVQVIGVVIDAGLCRVVTAGLDGVLIDRETTAFPTPESYEQLVEEIVARAQALMARSGVITFGLGISLPGLIDFREQRGLLSPNVPLTYGHSPMRDIGARLSIPGVRHHEEDALCLAERYYGNARGLDSFGILDVTTGVGLGVMAGGRLLTGRRGVAAEVGHVTVLPEGGRRCGCGNYGCLETEASDAALVRLVSARIGETLTVEELVARVLAGELTIEAEMERWCRFLGIGIAGVINVFNVSTLFIHGRLFSLTPDPFPRILREVERRALAPTFAGCRIVQARSSKRLGAVAGIIDYLITGLVPQPPAEQRFGAERRAEAQHWNNKGTVGADTGA